MLELAALYCRHSLAGIGRAIGIRCDAVQRIPRPYRILLARRRRAHLAGECLRGPLRPGSAFII